MKRSIRSGASLPQLKKPIPVKGWAVLRPAGRLESNAWLAFSILAAHLNADLPSGVGPVQRSRRHVEEAEKRVVNEPPYGLTS